MKIRIWNIARTSGQIAANYNKSFGPAPGLVGYWKFDEGSGSTAVDSSGFSNHGDLDPPQWVVSTAPVQVVPEPSTTVALLSGFGLLCIRARSSLTGFKRLGSSFVDLSGLCKKSPGSVLCLASLIIIEGIPCLGQDPIPTSSGPNFMRCSP